MAVDGVHIIEGDLAHDTYNGILDLYDAGKSVKRIRSTYSIFKRMEGGDFYHEIYVTSVGLAFWEIGMLTGEELTEIERVVERGAGKKGWSEEHSYEFGEARENVLQEFLYKISTPTDNPRKRIKYSKVSELLFKKNDVITFQLTSGEYACMICNRIKQYRGTCSYIFVPTTYVQQVKPSRKGLLEENILGRRIVSDNSRAKSMQIGIENIWEYCGESGFILGLSEVGIDHRDVLNIRNKFEKIDALEIKEGLNRMGSIGFEQDFKGFERIFGDLESQMKDFGMETFPIRLTCNTHFWTR